MKNERPMNSFKEGMDMWMEYAKAYTDFVVGMTQSTMESMMEARAQLDKVMTETTDKAMDMAAKEQEMAMGMMTAFQTQAKQMWDQSAKMMETAMSQNKTMATKVTHMMENAADSTRNMAEQVASAMDPNKKVK